ncbi:ABC transporter substrate-binding protein [Aquibium sp. ELW1220]|uniref:ABC transporter substrate-binding protein n=1 Tax=Aquibium sp. ELW1220 TaxID=2976766 RepID=UPI0025AF5048|nr:ABC transporter substrate-binding protein [Aquibium sp. ELW1220]MDN2581476.1 ABC transporter substrate-binding protein [Aquibium sp. ELW1220]
MRCRPATAHTGGLAPAGARLPGGWSSPLAVALVAAALAGPASRAAADEAPRVMSLNVCTDQLVLALAEPSRIVSLSVLSGDPDYSYLHAQAGAFPNNAGVAEEVFIARPDLVVTGTYSLHNTTQLLRHLGLRVEEFGYTQTLDTIAGDIRRMGTILGHADAGEAMAATFERDLAALALPADAPRPTAVIFGQNGVATGAGTLADSVLAAAGFRNLAAERGFSGMAPYSLELLVVDRPDVVLLSARVEDAPALADQVTRHPAIASSGAMTATGIVPRGSWSCGGPFTLEAVRALRVLRDELLAAEDASG